MRRTAVTGDEIGPGVGTGGAAGERDGHSHRGRGDTQGAAWRTEPWHVREPTAYRKDARISVRSRTRVVVRGHPVGSRTHRVNTKPSSSVRIAAGRIDLGTATAGPCAIRPASPPDSTGLVVSTARRPGRRRSMYPATTAHLAEHAAPALFHSRPHPRVRDRPRRHRRRSPWHPHQ